MSKQQMGVGLTVLGIAIPALIALVPGVIGYGRLQSQAADAQATANTADAKAQKAQDDVNKIPALISDEFRRHEKADQPLRDSVSRIEAKLDALKK